jgi:peptide/nickel transport system substrate-binding protein
VTGRNHGRSGPWKPALGLVLGLFAVAVLLLGLTQALGGLTYYLSGTSDLTPADVGHTPEKLTTLLDKVRFHQVAELDPGREIEFKEAPQLAALVEEGKLPPVGERLPKNPLVIIPPDQNGPYGGVWARYGNSPGDVSQFRHRIAYEALLRWDPMGQKLLPNLASRWEVGDGGRTFTFYLRHGVRWSDGHPFSADDIMFWYNDVLLNKKLTPGVGPTFRTGEDVVKVEQLDRWTIRFSFTQPQGLFLQHMAGEPGYDMVSFPAHYLSRFHPNHTPLAQIQKIAEERGLDFWYQVFQNEASWRNPKNPTLWAWTLIKPPPARPALFERNPYYWKIDPEGNQLPYIDKVTFDIYDLETINLKAINGEMGMQGRHLYFHNYQLFMANRDKGEYRVLRWLDGGTGNLVLCPNQNHKDKGLAAILGDKRFRQALSLAINRAEINEALYLGMCNPRQMAPPSWSKYYDPWAEKAFTDYDPAQANRLLDQAGLSKRGPDGYRLRPDGSPLEINLEVSSIIQGGKALELVANYWREVGVKAELKLMSRQLSKARINALIHDIGVWKGAGAMNPVVDPRYFIPYSKSSIQAVQYVKWFRSGGRKGPKPPPDMEEAIRTYWKISETPDEEEQIRLFNKILKLDIENLWVIGTVGDVPHIFLVQNRFRNVPEAAVSSWVVHTPGNTAPECYAIAEED